MIKPIAPQPATSRLAVRVTPAAERSIRRGHPWLFESAITNLSECSSGQAGDLAVVFDRKRRFLAIGLFDPYSQIRVKLLHHGGPTKIDEGWFTERIQEAFERRQRLDPNQTTGYRLVYGEGDGFPGLIIDRYNQTLVVKLYSAVWFPYLPHLLDQAQRLTSAHRIVIRLSRQLQQMPEICWGITDGDILWGDFPLVPVRYKENGLLFSANVVRGHKTGAFFDQRDNRLWTKTLAHGREVLDLFSYSGGFAVYAAAGGASSLTLVDSSQPALNLAVNHLQLNIELNLCPEIRYQTFAADVFKLLGQFHNSGRIFDFIIVDPPSFAKQKSEVEAALNAYRRLTHRVLDVLRPGGILLFASCSSRVSANQFFEVVFSAADEAGRPLWEHRRTGHALDHPLRPEFPEGAYLKCLIASPID